MQPNEEDFEHVLNFQIRAQKIEALLAASLGVVQLLRKLLLLDSRYHHAVALDALIDKAAEIGVLPQEVEL